MIEKDPKDLGLTAMLEAAKTKVSFDALLDNDYPTWKQVRKGITNYFVSDDAKDTFLTMAREYEAEGVQPYEVIDYDEKGYDFIVDFREVLIYEFSALKTMHLNLSDVGLMFDTESEARINRLLMIDNLFSKGQMPGAATLIDGPPRVGKTSIMANEIIVPWVKVMADYKIFLSFNIGLGNGKIGKVEYEKVPGYDEESCSGGTFGALLSTVLYDIVFHAMKGHERTKKPGRTIKLYDEAEIGRDRSKHSSNRNKAQAYLSKMWGHFGVHEVLALQEDRPPSEVLQVAFHKIAKPSVKHKDWVDVDINTEFHTFKGKLYNVQDSPEREEAKRDFWNYDSYGTQIMNIDINPLLMWDYVSGLNPDGSYLSTIDQYQGCLDYIKRHKGEGFEILSDEAVAILLWRQYNNCKKHPDPHMKKMGTKWRLAASVGWPEHKLTYQFDKIKEDNAQKEALTMHTDDIKKEYGVKVGASDESR